MERGGLPGEFFVLDVGNAIILAPANKIEHAVPVVDPMPDAHPAPASDPEPEPDPNIHDERETTRPRARFASPPPTS